jgi:hypothetical protein
VGNANGKEHANYQWGGRGRKPTGGAGGGDVCLGRGGKTAHKKPLATKIEPLATQHVID